MNKLTIITIALLCALPVQATSVLQGTIEQTNYRLSRPLTIQVPQTDMPPVAPPLTATVNEASFTPVNEQPQYGQQSMQLNGGTHQGYAGIGVTLATNLFEGVFVLKVLPSSPASRNDVQAGDLINAINGEPMYGHNALSVADRVLGQPGTEVTVTFRRDTYQGQQFLTKQFVRQAIESFEPQEQVQYGMTLRQLGWQP